MAVFYFELPDMEEIIIDSSDVKNKNLIKEISDYRYIKRIKDHF